jgi:hypothetical protein
MCRCACYRAMRLLHEHFGQDPTSQGENQFRDCILHAKTPTPLPDAPGRMITKKCVNARTDPCGLRSGYSL